MALSGGIAGEAKDRPARESGDEGARRRYQPDAPTVPGDDHRRDSGDFEGTGGQSDGLVADGSDRSQQSGIDILAAGHLKNRRDDLIDGLSRVGLVAHEAHPDGGEGGDLFLFD